MAVLFCLTGKSPDTSSRPVACFWPLPSQTSLQQSRAPQLQWPSFIRIYAAHAIATVVRSVEHNFQCLITHRLSVAVHLAYATGQGCRLHSTVAFGQSQAASLRALPHFSRPIINKSTTTIYTALLSRDTRPTFFLSLLSCNFMSRSTTLLSNTPNKSSCLTTRGESHFRSQS